MVPGSQLLRAVALVMPEVSPQKIAAVETGSSTCRSNRDAKAEGPN